MAEAPTNNQQTPDKWGQGLSRDPYTIFSYAGEFGAILRALLSSHVHANGLFLHTVNGSLVPTPAITSYPHQGEKILYS